MVGGIRESFGETPDWAEEPTEQEEYLDRLGVEEDDGIREVHPNEWEPQTERGRVEVNQQQTVGRTVRNTGARITHLESLNIETPNLMIGDATFSETEIDHPVIRELQDKIELLETESRRQNEVNDSILELLKEIVRGE